MSGDERSDGDEKTLRLSAPVLTPERLEKLIAFQRRFLAAAERAGTEAGLLRAHGEAVRASGLSAREASELEALARAYCGRRWTLRALEHRLAETRARVAQARAQGKPVSKKDLDALERLPKELPIRAELTPLERRYGAEPIRLLQAREEELLALHEALGRYLRR